MHPISRRGSPWPKSRRRARPFLPAKRTGGTSWKPRSADAGRSQASRHWPCNAAAFKNMAIPRSNFMIEVKGIGAATGSIFQLDLGRGLAKLMCSARVRSFICSPPHTPQGLGRGYPFEGPSVSPQPPAQPRVVTFLDGQNLFHSARAAFGYTYPNYDVRALSHAV